jgi:hypothetical protein
MVSELSILRTTQHSRLQVGEVSKFLELGSKKREKYERGRGMKKEEGVGGRVVKEEERLCKMSLYGPRAWHTKQKAVEEDEMLKWKSCRRKGEMAMGNRVIRPQCLA